MRIELSTKAPASQELLETAKIFKDLNIFYSLHYDFWANMPLSTTVSLVTSSFLWKTAKILSVEDFSLTINATKELGYIQTVEL